MQQTIDITYSNMKAMFLNGVSEKEIVEYAIENGHSMSEAQEILESIQQIGNDFNTEGNTSRTKLVVGSLFVVSGIIFSFIVPTGFIFYGVIIAGIFMIIRGLS